MGSMMALKVRTQSVGVAGSSLCKVTVMGTVPTAVAFGVMLNEAVPDTVRPEFGMRVVSPLVAVTLKLPVPVTPRKLTM